MVAIAMWSIAMDARVPDAVQMLLQVLGPSWVGTMLGCIRREGRARLAVACSRISKFVISYQYHYIRIAHECHDD
jgi:hypothetical protein